MALFRFRKFPTALVEIPQIDAMLIWVEVCPAEFVSALFFEMTIFET